MTTANHVAGQAVQQAVAHGSQNGSSVWIVWVALAMLALTVCAGYYYQTIHLVAVAAKKRSQRSLKEQTAIKKDDTQLSTFFRNFFVFVIWVHVWHFLLFLLDFQRGRGLSRLGFTEEEVGHQESRMLAFAWHFAVLLPVIVTLLVSYYLNVGREELYLFTCVAVATVSLEVCIGVLIKKSEYIRLLSHQTSLARQRFRNI
ncbi:MAG: hypothetical protein U0892_16700 [Pirellulales bacterium]